MSKKGSSEQQQYKQLEKLVKITSYPLENDLKDLGIPCLSRMEKVALSHHNTILYNILFDYKSRLIEQEAHVRAEHEEHMIELFHKDALPKEHFFEFPPPISKFRESEQWNHIFDGLRNWEENFSNKKKLDNNNNYIKDDEKALIGEGSAESI